MPIQLALPDCPHYAVFQVIVNTLRKPGTDLHRVVRNWYVWSGEPADNDTVSVGACPAIELTPSGGPDAWYGPSGIIGPLYVDVDCYTAGTSVRDSLNLYHAVKRALYPADGPTKTAIHQALVAAGAEGEFLLQFTQGRYAPAGSGKEALFVATGQIMVRIRSDLNA